MADGVYRIDLKARFLLDGKEIPIQSFELDFSLDKITEGSVLFAVGTNVNTLAESPAVETMKTVEAYTPVEILLTAIPRGPGAPTGKPLGFPIGEFTVFKGFCGSPFASSSREAGTAAVGVKLIGQQAGLTAASSYAKGIVGTVGYNGDAFVNLGFAGDVAASATQLLSKQLKGLSSGLWDPGIVSLFGAVSHVPPAWDGLNTDDATDLIEDALKRINEDGDLADWAHPLAFNYNFGASLDLFEEQLIDYFSSRFFASWVNGGTLWDVLLSYLKDLQLNFVPGVKGDLIVPVFHGIFADPWAIIDTSEYHNFQWGRGVNPLTLGRPTRAALIEQTGVAPDPFDREACKIPALGFASVDAKTEAQMILLPAPDWLSKVNSTGRYSKQSTGSGKGIPSADYPDADVQEEPSKTQNKETSILRGLSIGNDYTLTALYSHMFPGAFSFDGRLRFDIAPGSFIQVKVAENLRAKTNTSVYGIVQSVKIRIGDKQAGTSFLLGSVRSDEEQLDLTEEEHPMYEELWIGAPLVPGSGE